MGDNIGIPSDSVDRIFDFIDTIWDQILVLVIALVEMGWTLFVKVFIDLAPAFGFALIMCFWLYMFYTKFIERTPR